MIPGPPCPLCGHPDTVLRHENTDFLFRTSRDRFRVFVCASCRCGFQHPRPSAATLSTAYPARYWWVAGEKARGLGARMEEAYRETVLRHHVRVARKCFPVPAPDVLDVGCGSGTFLHLLQKKGARVTGLEVSPEAARAVRDHYGFPVENAGVEDADLPPASFDLVTSFHVLEHLGDPLEALRRMGGWLRPGGALLVQVPNFASLQARLFGRRWTGIDLPRHLWDFTPEAVESLMRSAGLTPFLRRTFSLRDNAAAAASSLFPRHDPVAMSLTGDNRFAFSRKLFYFGIVLLSQLPACLEAATGHGATVFVAARRPSQPERPT